jgi:protein-ribulosamine 3-kinase
MDGKAVMVLMNDPLRVPIEKAVSEYIGQKWTVKDFKDMKDYASHPSAILSNGSYSVFAKFSSAANGLEQFEIELTGLELLSRLSGISTPTPIGIVSVEGGVVMVQESIPSVKRTSRQWREIGRSLARIHKVKGTQYGLASHCYFGPLYQDNRPMEDWATFYAERRVWTRFMGAINSGNMPTDAIRQVEKLITRLPDLCGPDIEPTLLHGDAQKNNFITTENETFVIDPAVYYGHPEIDLAYMDYFEPVPEDVFIGYQELMPIDPGFHERRDLWRVYGWLSRRCGSGRRRTLGQINQRHSEIYITRRDNDEQKIICTKAFIKMVKLTVDE